MAKAFDILLAKNELQHVHRLGRKKIKPRSILTDIIIIKNEQIFH